MSLPVQPPGIAPPPTGSDQHRIFVVSATKINPDADGTTHEGASGANGSSTALVTQGGGEGEAAAADEDLVLVVDTHGSIRFLSPILATVLGYSQVGPTGAPTGAQQGLQ